MLYKLLTLSDRKPEGNTSETIVLLYLYRSLTYTTAQSVPPIRVPQPSVCHLSVYHSPECATYPCTTAQCVPPIRVPQPSVCHLSVYHSPVCATYPCTTAESVPPIRVPQPSVCHLSVYHSPVCATYPCTTAESVPPIRAHVALYVARFPQAVFLLDEVSRTCSCFKGHVTGVWGFLYFYLSMSD